MKIKSILAVGVFLGIAVLPSCKRLNGKGDVTSRTYPLNNFNRIELSAEGDVVTMYDATEFVEVNTHENLYDALELKVEGQTLKIGTKKGYSIGKYDELKYVVHCNGIVEVDLDGSGTITITSGTAGSSFDAAISGSGDLTADGLNTSDLVATITGSGNLNLTGQSADSELEITGSGNIRSFDLTSAITKATITGSGNIETRTTSHLEAIITGSGNVKYKGTPTVDQNITGSGSVIDAN